MNDRIALLDLDPRRAGRPAGRLGSSRAYRADQVWEWLYQQLAARPGADDQPADRRCARGWPPRRASTRWHCVYEQRSSDGQTNKWLFRLPDGQTIETVLMLYPQRSTRERRTVCISTQAGCAMGCVFCATGQAGLARNLTAGRDRRPGAGRRALAGRAAGGDRS